MTFPDDFIPQTGQEWDRVRVALLEAAGWACHYCGARLRLGRSSIDHQIPRVKGGTDHFVNLVICCGRCNSSKGGRTTNGWQEPGEGGE